MKRTVSFDSAGQTLTGDLYLPDNYEDGTRLPGVVVTGAWTSVKEQMPGTYAAELADRGFAALAFDFRGWGASPDAVQFLEDPTRKTDDIVAAIEFMATRDEVDPASLAGLGICASAGYMSDAALQSPKIKALALVAPWLHNAAIVDAVYGGQDGVSALIAAGRDAEAPDTPVVIEAASATNEQSLMFGAPYYTETDRGLIAEYDNRFNVASWEPWLTYDAIQTAHKLDKPTLLVHSDAAAIPQGTKQYAEIMGDNAETIWLDGVTQFDFYDQPAAVTTSADAVARHFASELSR
ncbi:MAG: alpha/beta fold hydrolase [Pseudomonadota bacterium]